MGSSVGLPRRKGVSQPSRVTSNHSSHGGRKKQEGEVLLDRRSSSNIIHILVSILPPKIYAFVANVRKLIFPSLGPERRSHKEKLTSSEKVAAINKKSFAPKPALDCEKTLQKLNAETCREGFKETPRGRTKPPPPVTYKGQVQKRHRRRKSSLDPKMGFFSSPITHSGFAM